MHAPSFLPFRDMLVVAAPGKAPPTPAGCASGAADATLIDGDVGASAA
jgi:hypothetical protein